MKMKKKKTPNSRKINKWIIGERLIGEPQVVSVERSIKYFSFIRFTLSVYFEQKENEKEREQQHAHRMRTDS